MNGDFSYSNNTYSTHFSVADGSDPKLGWYVAPNPNSGNTLMPDAGSNFKQNHSLETYDPGTYGLSTTLPNGLVVN